MRLIIQGIAHVVFLFALVSLVNATSAPKLKKELKLHLLAKGEKIEIELKDLFSDADGDHKFDVRSVDPLVATVSRTGSKLTITAVEEGETMISASAGDIDGSISTAAILTVIADPLPKENYISVAAIKSVAGEKPENEFFDVNFLFKGKLGNVELLTFGSLDVALTSVDTSTTVINVLQNDSLQATSTITGADDRLSEAGLSMNIGFPPTGGGGKIYRQRYIGFVIKLFDATPYYGLHFGSIELKDSALFTSYLRTGILKAWNKDVSPRTNIYVEFLIRSSLDEVPLFDALAIKGGVLFPKDISSNDDIKFRIAVEVPLGKPYSFR